MAREAQVARADRRPGSAYDASTVSWWGLVAAASGSIASYVMAPGDPSKLASCRAPKFAGNALFESFIAEHDVESWM